MLTVEDHRHIPPRDVRALRPQVGGEPEVQPRRGAVDPLVDLPVQGCARRIVGGAAGAQNQRVRHGIRVERIVAAGAEIAGIEERIEEIVGVGVIGPPVEHYHVGLAFAGRLALARGVALDQLDPDADRLELSLHRLRHPRQLDIARMAPQRGGDPASIAGSGEQPFCLDGVVVVARARGVALPPGKTGRDRSPGENATPAVNGGENLGRVHGVVDRLPHPHVLERSAPVVERHVHHPQGGLLEQQVRVVPPPLRRLAERHFHHAAPPRLELRRPRERLRDDPHRQRVGGRRPTPIVRVLGEHQVVVVLPGHEAPGAGAHRMLTEVRLRGEGRRYDRGYGHREELGKDRERLRQVEGDGRISQQLDARYVARPAGGVGFRTGDRVERPGAPAGPPRARRQPQARVVARQARGVTRSVRMQSGVEKVDSVAGGSQHRGAARPRQLRALLPFLLVAVSAAAPLAAQQERVVRGLSFEGNHAIDDYTLETAIATSSSSVFASLWLLRWMGLGEKRYFNELEFRRDVVRLLLLYRQSGYMNAVVDTMVRREGGDVHVLFRIYEGEPVRLTKLKLVGLDSILGVAALKRTLPLREGEPFNRTLFQASADTIADRLRNLGYPYAELLRSYDVDATALKAEASLEALPGPRARID